VGSADRGQFPCLAALSADNDQQMLCVDSYAALTIDLGARFVAHAGRVRTLDLVQPRRKHGTHDLVRDVAPAVLAMWAARRELFPRLVGLLFPSRFLQRTQEHPALFSSFLAYTALRRLEVHSGPEALEPFEHAQAALTDACASLHELVLANDAGNWYPDCGRAVFNYRWGTLVQDMVWNAPQLRRLTVTLPMDHSDLLFVCTLPELVELTVSSVDEVPERGQGALPPGAFPVLRSLTIKDGSKFAPLCYSLLAFASGPTFERCSLHIDHALPGAEVAALLAEVFKHEYLAHIAVRFREDGYGKFNDLPAETADLLAGLCPSERVRSLTIGVAFPLDAIHIHTVLSLYPGLEGWKWGRDEYSRAIMSLEDFMAITKARPAIRDLPVIISLSDLPSTDARAAFGTHGYDTSVRIQLATDKNGSKRQDELCAAIGELFPNVRPHMVSMTSSDVR
jgi:hypothetical protein